MWRQGAPAHAMDAWGSDDDETTSWAAPAKQPKTPSRLALAAPARQLVPAAAGQLQQQEQQTADQRLGPDSLHAICLGVLGEHLGELLECGEDVLPLLPAPAKACLLAVARLRRLVCDAALALLADAEQSILDLHGCGELVTDGGIRAALLRMPHLRYADLRSCPVGDATLRVLGEACPGVEVLRLGSRETDETGGRALKDILPVLVQRQQAPAAESWDTLLSVEEPHALAAAVAGGGRLMQLQSLVWPNIPFRLQEYCRTACPAVALNPAPEVVARRRLSPACDPGMQLDAALLQEVAGSWRWEREPEATPGPPVMHIAELFRLAYVSREQRVRAKQERQWQQQRRREERERSKAERLIEKWEGEL